MRTLAAWGPTPAGLQVKPVPRLLDTCLGLEGVEGDRTPAKQSPWAPHMWFFHFASGRCRILAPGGNNACGDSWIQGALVVIATGAHQGLPWGLGDALPCSMVFGAVDAFPSQLLRAVIDALRDCPGSYHVLLSPRQAQRTSGAGLLVQGCWECGSCPPAPITV